MPNNPCKHVKSLAITINHNCKDKEGAIYGAMPAKKGAVSNTKVDK